MPFSTAIAVSSYLAHAVEDYSTAIRINPFLPGRKAVNVYVNRALVYEDQGDLDRAIADYTQALTLDPKQAIIYTQRGRAYDQRGDVAHAVADYDQAIALDPNGANAYFHRGRLNLFAGALPKALADLDRAAALKPAWAYAALWLDIANKRSNLPSRLAEATARLDIESWPAPLIHLYLGDWLPNLVQNAANNAPTAELRADRLCQTNFYAGELALKSADKDEAIKLFRKVAADCRKGLMERDSAIAELKSLGVVP